MSYFGKCFGNDNYDNFDIKNYDKAVMFEESSITKNADITREKHFIIRHHRLSHEDRQYLYQERPDLNLRSDLDESLLDNSTECDTSIGDYDQNNDISTASDIIFQNIEACQINCEARSYDYSDDRLTNSLESISLTSTDMVEKIDLDEEEDDDDMNSSIW